MSLNSDFYQGKTISTYQGFRKHKAYLQSALSQEERELWIRVFEKFYSMGDQKIQSEATTILFLDILQELKFGLIEVKVEQPAKPSKEEQLDEDDKPGPMKLVSFKLSESYYDGVEYFLWDDKDKNESFEMIRTDDVLRFQFEYAIFHFGIKTAMYFGAIENLKQIIMESGQTIWGNTEKREAKLMSRLTMTLKAPELLELVEKLRWELFAANEEQMVKIASKGPQEELVKRRQKAKQDGKL